MAWVPSKAYRSSLYGNGYPYSVQGSNDRLLLYLCILLCVVSGNWIYLMERVLYKCIYFEVCRSSRYGNAMPVRCTRHQSDILGN